MLGRQRVEWTDNEGEMNSIQIDTGVPQGEPLSMLLFAIGIDRVVQDFEKREGVHMTAYADDVVMVLDNPENIIEMMNEFENMSKECGLSINFKKTKIGTKCKFNEEIENELKEKGIQIIDIMNDNLEYVGLPITISEKREEEVLEKHVKEYIETTKKLWNYIIPTQMKYHLQKLCLDSKLTHIMKAIPVRRGKLGKWMDSMQKEIEACWRPFIPGSDTKYARLPTRYYGLGLMNLKDRRIIGRNQWEQKEKLKKGEQEKLKDVTAEYYLNKMKKWVNKGLVQNIDIIKIPQESNLSLSQPPSTGIHRLSESAFKTMLVLRYCTSEMEHIFRSLNNPPTIKCLKHNQINMTVQHAITCNKIGISEAIRRHDAIVSKVAGLLMRKKKIISNVKRENYTTKQKANKVMGKGKRADITYLWKGVDEHSVDVKITSSWSDKAGNAVNRALGAKEREYKGEERLHIILFDTAGNVAKESLEYLKSIGAGRSELREMQKIILEFTSMRINTLAEQGKQNDYKEAREKQRNERRNKSRQKKNKKKQSNLLQCGAGELNCI